MAKWKLTRTMLVREYVTITVEMPDDFDPDSYDFDEVDEFVCAEPATSWSQPMYEGVDNDELEHESWERV